MEPLQIEIKDKYKTWGVYDILQIGWEFQSKKIEWIKIDWYKKPGEELLYMLNDWFNNSGDDNSFTNIYGNLTGKIL